MKSILQHDERDCGAACLAMIAGYYGYFQSLNAYRELTNTDQDGTSAYEIINAASSIGLMGEALSGNIDELLDSLHKNEFNTPFIAHIVTEDNYSHFVVVASINERKVRMYDPAKGKVNESLDDFAEKWTGNIVTFVKTDDFKKKKAESEGIVSFFPNLKDQVRKIIGIIILSFIISGVGIAGAFAFQIIIDHSSEMIVSEDEYEHHEHDIEYLTDSEWLNSTLEGLSDYFEHLTVDGVSMVFTWLIILYALSAIIQYFRGRLIISMSRQIDLNITLPYFNKLTEMPMSSIMKRRTGDYLSRYSDITAIREAISTAVITMILDTVMALGCGLILYFQNSRLFLIAGVIILVYSAVVIFNRKRIKDSNRIFMERNAYVHSYMKECIDGMEAIKAVGAEKQVQETMRGKFGSYISAAVRKSRITMTQDALVTGIETIGIAFILWQGFTMVIQEQMTLGALITFYALLGYLISPVKNLIELQPALQSGNVAAERLNDVMGMSSEETKGNETGKLNTVNNWKVSSLNFRYGLKDQLIKNASFSFKKGETVALVGESGSGKTTLAKLFVRFFEAESGQILADGIDIKDYSVRTLRNSIVYVNSDAMLFSGTLYDNLKLGNDGCTDEEIQRVCTIIGISDMLDDFSGIRQFVIEEGGTNLSSGQRQRVAVARALLKRPSLIILDEATSNLDIKAEAEMLTAIKREMEDVTVLMISHRIASVKKFDKIVVMQTGTVVGEGTHEELKADCREYRSLMELNDC